MNIDELARKAAPFGKTINELRLLAEDKPAGPYIIREVKASDFEAMVYEPVLCLILQGSKEITIGGRTIWADKGDLMIVSHDIPVSTRIANASPAEPYLALVMTADLDIIRSLHAQMGELTQGAAMGFSLDSSRADDDLLGVLGRYLDVMTKPQEREVLEPLILREIHFRVLMAPNGKMLRQLLSRDSHASRISKAITHMRSNFTKAESVAQLSRLVGMSQSSFHEHFKSITGTTPLQYQKDLRLIEAQQMLLGGTRSVSNVAYSVGYESITQFSREFARKFGASPRVVMKAALAEA